MARNSRSEAPRARLFLALEPDDADRGALARWRDALVAGRDDLRPAPAATLHLTLAFLGHLPESEIDAIARTGLGAVAGLRPALLEPGEVVPLPRRSPRLFALDLADPGGHAAAVQSAVAGALAAAGLHEPERRPWWPHVTLARVRRGGHAGSLEAGAGPPPARLRAPLVTLYRSILHPHGARYEPLERVCLDASPGGS